jgi:hypothetical protein
MAEEILIFPECIADEAWWPSEEQLLVVGARFLTQEGPRVVEIDGRRFSEGMLEDLIREISDNQFEEVGQGRPNQTHKKSVQ